MIEPGIETVESRGRPRRYDETTERRMLLDATMRLMVRRGDAAIAVADVLDEAGLSTRSFYRHFESKDALVAAVVEREVGSVARALERSVDESPDPVAALDAWLTSFLATFLDPRRSARSAVLTEPAITSGSPGGDELTHIRSELCRPLADALRRGHAAGVFRSDDPDADAIRIFGLTTASAQAPGRPEPDAVAEQVRGFVHRALGLGE